MISRAMLLLSCMVLGICVLCTHAGSIFCPADAKLCKDQITYVSRDSSRNCQFHKCPPCVKRRLDFNHQDYFTFTINQVEGSDVDRALRGSKAVYKGGKDQDLRILMRYKYDQAGIQDNRGFRGKVCFKVKGAQSIEADYAGISRVTCEPMFGTCQGVGGGVFRDPANSNIKLTSRFLLPDINQPVMVKNLDATHLGFSPFQTGLYQVPVQPGSYHEHCVEAFGNDFVGFTIGSAGGKMRVKAFYFKGCEAKT